MAKFNGNIYGFLTEKDKKEEIVKVLPMLQEMLSQSDYNQLRKDYHNNVIKISFWRFVFENIEIKYKKSKFLNSKISKEEDKWEDEMSNTKWSRR